MEVGGQRHVPSDLPPRKIRCHCIGGGVGLRAGLEGCGLIFLMGMERVHCEVRLTF